MAAQDGTKVRPIVDDARMASIRRSFIDVYKSEPHFYARSPGRVNLIGEHIDYCGYSVLPMAIEYDIISAVRVSDDNQLRLANTNSKFADINVDLNNIDINSKDVKWHDYFLCGVMAIKERHNYVKGMSILVDGNVPVNAGLSSSSALVCSSALATMKANNIKLSMVELAEACIKCEKYVGLEGGGMDQTISLTAKEGKAKVIEFVPRLVATDVQLPTGCQFVVGHSCAELNKANTGQYNTRVAECRMAAQIIARNKGLDWREIRTLRKLQDALETSLADMALMVDAELPRDSYTKGEICEILGVSAAELETVSLNPKCLDVQSFKLRSRALHVYSEARRVHQFHDICTANPPNALQLLGDLMNDSHRSCADLYECSCAELDELVCSFTQHGALGARLTGAGWGGCAVALVAKDSSQATEDAVRLGYYVGDKQQMGREYLFTSLPSDGACIYEN